MTNFGVKTRLASGGFYLFLDFCSFKQHFLSKGIINSDQQCTNLLIDTSVALLPDTAFGVESSHFVARLAYVDFEDPMSFDTFNLIQNAPRIVAGIKILTEWLSNL